VNEPPVSPAFDLSGGHPVLDFINTLDQRFQTTRPVERLTEYGDLLRFAQQTQLLDAAQVRRLAVSVEPAAGAQALRSARQLREALAATLYGNLEGRIPSADDLQTLARHFQETLKHRQLRWQASATAHGGAGMSWQWGADEKHAELPVWMLAEAASELVLSAAMERVRACGAETCRWLFLDTSKNHTRRWCNMKVCGNRMKAQRFHARRTAVRKRAKNSSR
jgi:predicted RNA-binding Zn ribbon-like protein